MQRTISRRRCTPLSTGERTHQETKKEEKVRESETKKEVEEHVKNDNIGIPLSGSGWNSSEGYPTPKSSCDDILYVPLVKNVISERELMWKDGPYTIDNYGEDYYKPALQQEAKTIVPASDYMHSSKDDLTKFQNGTITRLKGEFEVAYILGDGTILAWDHEQGGDWDVGHHETFFLGNVTDKMCVIFTGAHYGIIFYIRLIDDRIENAAGPDDPQIVCYDPRGDVLKVTRQGWWQPQFFTEYNSDQDHDLMNMSLYGRVEVMYPWNVIHTGYKAAHLYFSSKNPPGAGN